MTTIARDWRFVTQRELRNESGEIMRGLERGEAFVVTRNGTPVGDLQPIRRRRFIDTRAALAALRDAAPIDARRFRADVDRVLDQDPAPRA